MDHVRFSLYPFGNAKATPTANVSKGYLWWHPEAELPHVQGVVQCQNGEEECFGNMIHACALHRMGENHRLIVPFLSCMAKRPTESIEKSSFDCAEELGVDLDTIKSCVHSPEANRVMFRLEERSNNLEPKRAYVPWVTVNGRHIVSMEEGNMVSGLCTALLGSRLGAMPKACADVEIVQMAEGKSSPIADQAQSSRSIAGVWGSSASSAPSSAHEATDTHSPAMAQQTDKMAASLLQHFASAGSSDSELLRLEVFYESQCPYSLQLLQDLRSLFSTTLRDYISLGLYPFGNARTIPRSELSRGYAYWHPERRDEEAIIKCQHGESECLGNAIHACAAQELPETKLAVEFIACMADSPSASVEKSSHQCATQLGFDLQRIKDCALDASVNKRMLAIGHHSNSLAPPRAYTPYVTLSGLHVEMAEHGHMIEMICTALLGQGKSPEACSGIKLLQGAN
eukprot:gnl/TRDRNA2_/TRDRNA2_83165_c0_seq1.p1 gnl/TRDRNA2_/TRDRNA2_83165_c0~~gnl/TRDRNA2_/TRDRNA2_83165_c0_seq1.p1  ORF type:complete len:456 (+),score=82.82 gnl/TRDRNA2_/TRDRNA2_83165_c0_seq1:2-1369(+)